MGRKYSDSALTTLASSITSGSTTLTVPAGKGDNFPITNGHGTPGSTPDFFVITMENSSGAREKIRVEQRASGNDTLGSAGFPLVRGYEGTTAAAWNTGDSVDLRWEGSPAQDHEDRVQASRLAFGTKGSATGLTYGYYGGYVVVDGVLTQIADSGIALTASQSNFVEMTLAGVVSANTTAFSADKIPLALVTTDASGITSISDRRADNYPVFGALSLSVAGGTDVNLTADQARAPILILTGALTGNINVNFPNVKREWIVRNDTTGAFSLTARVIGQTGASLFQGSGTIVYGDGTDIKSLGLPNPLVLPGGLTVGGLINLGSTGQLQFPATQNPSAGANVFDDYEEGTFTPAVGGSATYTNQLGAYVKIGKVVVVEIFLAINTIGTGLTNIITGLPFAGAATSRNLVGAWASVPTPLVSLMGNIGVSSIVQLLGQAAAVSSTSTTTPVLANGASVTLTGPYFTS